MCKYLFLDQNSLKLEIDFSNFLEELLKSLEQGEPTAMVQALLTELSSNFHLNLGGTFASTLLGASYSPTNGTELINRVL